MPEVFKVDVDTSYLRYDPNDKGFLEKIEGDIPAFREYVSDDVKSKQARVRVFAWVVLMYDMNSPLRNEVMDLYQRKVYAGNLVGMSPNKISGKYKEYIENIFLGKDVAVNKLITKYISTSASPEYTQLVAHTAIQHNILQKIIAHKEKKEDQVMFDTATEKVKKLTSFLYGSGERDEVADARRALYRQVSEDLNDMRPERIATRVGEGMGVPDEWNPYESGYVPDQMSYVSDDPDDAGDDQD